MQETISELLQFDPLMVQQMDEMRTKPIGIIVNIFKKENLGFRTKLKLIVALDLLRTETKARRQLKDIFKI